MSKSYIISEKELIELLEYASLIDHVSCDLPCGLEPWEDVDIAITEEDLAGFEVYQSE